LELRIFPGIGKQAEEGEAPVGENRCGSIEEEPGTSPGGFSRNRRKEVMRYTVVLEHESDNGFVVSVPVLPGCVSQGDTREEALKNIREAIEVYLEDCRLAGDPVPEEDSLDCVELKTGTLS
jgi:predicted RNase H-like HicB family nuclease